MIIRKVSDKAIEYVGELRGLRFKMSRSKTRDGIASLASTM